MQWLPRSFREMHKAVGQFTERRFGIHAQLSTEWCRIVGDSQYQTKDGMGQVSGILPISTIHHVDQKVPSGPENRNPFIEHRVVIEIHGYQAQNYGSVVVKAVKGVPSMERRALLFEWKITVQQCGNPYY